jgi:hypothetical protein
MDSSTSPRICKACGYPYKVDESTGSHMDPPDDYRRGYQRYCLTCWLGVGPKDETDLWGTPAQSDHPKKLKRLGNASGAENRPGQRPAAKPLIKQKPSVYLWLCCEGWMKFGPFEWLRFDDERQAILGPDGEEVARKVDGQWRVSEEKWQGWGFSDPTITTTPFHPHKDCSSHPGSSL